jgi:hypothetical protein
MVQDQDRMQIIRINQAMVQELTHQGVHKYPKWDEGEAARREYMMHSGSAVAMCVQIEFFNLITQSWMHRLEMLIYGRRHVIAPGCRCPAACF